jgi:phosphatidylinositol glycan class B
VLAALTDLYTFKLARKLLNERAAWITLIPTLFSLYTFHTSTRTLSNSTEAAFTIVALYYWPLSLPEESDNHMVVEVFLIDEKALQFSLIFFALSTILRPSNVLMSLPLAAILVWRILRKAQSAATLVEAAMGLWVVGRACLLVG